MARVIFDPKEEASKKLKDVVGKIHPNLNCNVKAFIPTPMCGKLAEEKVVDVEEYIRAHNEEEIRSAANHIETCLRCRRTLAKEKAEHEIPRTNETPLQEGVIKKLK